MKAYLDNDVVSAIAKDDNASESSALDHLLVAYEERKVELVTSEITLEEINAYRGEERALVQRVFRFLEKVPIVRWDELMGVNSYGDKYTWINAPMIQNDPAYDALLSLGLKVVDARHVFVATKHTCDAFLTCDRGILHRAAEIGKLCGVVVQKPSELVAAQGW